LQRRTYFPASHKHSFQKYRCNYPRTKFDIFLRVGKDGRCTLSSFLFICCMNFKSTYIATKKMGTSHIVIIGLLVVVLCLVLYGVYQNTNDDSRSECSDTNTPPIVYSTYPYSTYPSVYPSMYPYPTYPSLSRGYLQEPRRHHSPKRDRSRSFKHKRF
jgi:hypothetical protein